MILSIWNIRGLNKAHKYEEVKHQLHVHSVGIMGILETRVKEHNKKKIQKSYGNKWAWHDNYICSSKGRTWLGWLKTDVDVTILQTKKQYIHFTVTYKPTHWFLYCTVVYGLHTIEHRKSMWDELTTLARGLVDTPWILSGDFNAIRWYCDRDNGAPVSDTETRDFERFILLSGCTELQVLGPYFTWSNKGIGAARISIRIDRVVVNSVWWSSFLLQK